MVGTVNKRTPTPLPISIGKIKYNDRIRLPKYLPVNNIEAFLLQVPLAFAIVGAIWLFLVGFCVVSLAGSVTNFGDNALYSFLEADITGYSDGQYNSIVSTFIRALQKITETIYPIMGIYALFMIGLHMVGTVIFLMHPIFWREVHRLHIARKAKSAGQGKGITGAVAGIRDVISEQGISGFLKSIIPDVAEIAFEEALALNGDEDYIPTLGDFFKYNMIKYIGIIAMCMLIMDKTLITFLFRGAEVVVSFAKRGAYNYNYVVMIDNFLEQGKDYTPPYNTTEQLDANKKMIFDKIYAICKSDCTEQSQRTTTALQAMGQSIYTYVENNIAPNMGESMNFKNFTVKAEKVLIGTGAYPNGKGQYFIPYSQVGFPESTDVVAVYITAVEDTVTDTDYRKTNYTSCWTVPSGSSIDSTVPTAFNYVGVDNTLSGANPTGTGSAGTGTIKGYATVRYIYSDGTSSSESIKVDETTSSLPLASKAPTGASVYAISIDSRRVTYANGNGLVMGTAIWRNNAIILGAETTEAGTTATD